LTHYFKSVLITVVEEEVKNQKSDQSSYKKRPLWQLILIYAVVGAVIYGLIYYFVFYKKGKSYSSQDYNNRQDQSYNQPTDVPANTTKPNAEEEEATIKLTKSGFDPQTATVKVGSKVIWINGSGEDATVNSANHPTHQLYPLLNLGEFADGESLSLVFNTAGTYRYHNHLDSSVFGSIIVE